MIGNSVNRWNNSKIRKTTKCSKGAMYPKVGGGLDQILELFILHPRQPLVVDGDPS